MTIKSFSPLHQMTNYVTIPGMPIPQISQMTSYPTIPSQNPLVQHSPLVDPLRDIAGRNRTIEDVFHNCLQLCEKQRKQQEEEFEKRIQKI